MEPFAEDPLELLKESRLYQEFLAEREEILRHKLLESRKSGYGIAFERALVDWVVSHRHAWRQQGAIYQGRGIAVTTFRPGQRFDFYGGSPLLTAVWRKWHSWFPSTSEVAAISSRHRFLEPWQKETRTCNQC